MRFYFYYFQSWRVNYFSIERCKEHYVNSGCGDSNAAGRSDDQANSTARRVDNDGRRHWRERTFARLDHVGRAGRQSVEIERAGRREIGHFVVQDDARLRRSESGAQTIRAKNQIWIFRKFRRQKFYFISFLFCFVVFFLLQIDGRGDSDGHSVSIDNGHVRRPVILRSVGHGPVVFRIVESDGIFDFRTSFIDERVRNQQFRQLSNFILKFNSIEMKSIIFKSKKLINK